MGKLTRDGILAIKEILTSFATISGLKCNVEKSKILIIGSDLPILEYVLNSGFAVTNTLKILGFDITADKNDLYKNYDKVIDKMRNIVRFWERFRLSLPGRINVAKSLLLSQISYYGSIIPVRNETVSELQSIMNNFISGKMRLSGKQILTSVDKALLM
jgi:P2-related tail formation protein